MRRLLTLLISSLVGGGGGGGSVNMFDFSQTANAIWLPLV